MIKPVYLGLTILESEVTAIGLEPRTTQVLLEAGAKSEGEVTATGLELAKWLRFV